MVAPKVRQNNSLAAQWKPLNWVEALQKLSVERCIAVTKRRAERPFFLLLQCLDRVVGGLGLQTGAGGWYGQ